MRKELVTSLTRRINGVCKIVEVYKITDRYGPEEYRIINKGSAFYWQTMNHRGWAWRTKKGALKAIENRTQPV